MFGILFSFGVVFPPLGVVVTASLVSYTVYTQLLLGRYVELREDSEAGTGAAAVWMQQEAACVGSLFRSAVWVPVPFCTVLFGFLLFDTLGDQVGYQKALWMPIVTCLLPGVFWCVYMAAARSKAIGASVLKGIRTYSTGDVPLTSLSSLSKS